MQQPVLPRVRARTELIYIRSTLDYAMLLDGTSDLESGVDHRFIGQSLAICRVAMHWRRDCSQRSASALDTCSACRFS
jgi:hypothetical protein